MKVTDGANFATLFDNACKENEIKTSSWVNDLIQSGIVAAHPDDGWVDRILNRVHFCYPYFMLSEKMKLGAEIVLGTQDKYRKVKLLFREQRMFGMEWWYFVEVR